MKSIEQQAIDMVTIEMLNELTYGEEIQLNDKFCLYHYIEDDLVVFNDSEEWEELYVIEWNDKTSEIIFEKC
jgi:translation elongation factor P/translation initiation factor 5A